jgi:RNA polymerase sigma factor (sigma-70 family)
MEAERRERFELLFQAHSADIVAYCGWRADSDGDAQDAVGEVFLTAWRRLDEVPEGEAARIWLYATARRVIANQRRSNRRRGALGERLALEAGTARQQSSTDDDHGLVHEALRLLGPRDREVLLLAEWEGLTPAQIARVVGCLTVTARGRLHRARRRFKAVYDELATTSDVRALRPAPAGRRTPVHVREGGS